VHKKNAKEGRNERQIACKNGRSPENEHKITDFKSLTSVCVLSKKKCAGICFCRGSMRNFSERMVLECVLVYIRNILCPICILFTFKDLDPVLFFFVSWPTGCW